jgi:hypothetical protein
MLNQGFGNLNTINVPQLLETDLVLQTVNKLIDNVLNLTGRRVTSALRAAGRIGRVIKRVHSSLGNLELGKQIVQLRGIEGKLWGEGTGIHKVEIGVPKIDIKLSVQVQLDAKDIVSAIFQSGTASMGMMNGIVSYVGQGAEGMEPGNQVVTTNPRVANITRTQGGRPIQGGEVFGNALAPNASGQAGADLRTAIGYQ